MRLRWLLVPALLSLAVPEFPAADGAAGTSYYPLAPGTRWVYRQGAARYSARVVREEKLGDATCAVVETRALRTVAVEGRDTDVEDGSATTEHLAARDDGVYRHAFNGRRAEPPVCILKLPALAGQSWQVESRILGLPARATFTVGAESQVAVPAGKYDAVTVQSDDFEANSQRLALTLWFAAGVGLVKQEVKAGDQTVVLELEKFEPVAKP